MSEPAVTPESSAFAATLAQVDPGASTACAGWTPHDITAHLAAAGQEIAELIEDQLDGRPTRVHGRSEAALHRWDMIGDDVTGDELLAQPELTRHAVEVLNSLPMLNEAPGARAAGAGLTDTRIVLRSPGRSDVLLAVCHGEARFESATGDSNEGDAIVVTDPVNRLLTLWGRRSRHRDVTITADPGRWSTIATTLWPTATPWPL